MMVVVCGQAFVWYNNSSFSSSEIGLWFAGRHLFGIMAAFKVIIPELLWFAGRHLFGIIASRQHPVLLQEHARTD